MEKGEGSRRDGRGLSLPKATEGRSVKSRFTRHVCSLLLSFLQVFFSSGIPHMSSYSSSGNPVAQGSRCLYYFPRIMVFRPFNECPLAM